METKIQLIHPAGKKAININREKYEVIKKAIVNYLKTKGKSTHKEILLAITEDFKLNNTRFGGSVEWHMEWVKLDLEARKEIKRMDDESPVKFSLV